MKKVEVEPASANGSRLLEEKPTLKVYTGDVYKPKEVAKALKISEAMVRTMCEDGRLEATNIGKKGKDGKPGKAVWRIFGRSIDAYLHPQQNSEENGAG